MRRLLAPVAAAAILCIGLLTGVPLGAALTTLVLLPSTAGPIEVQTIQFGPWDRFDPMTQSYHMYASARATGADGIKVTPSVNGALTYHDYSRTDIPPHPSLDGLDLEAAPSSKVSVTFTATGSQKVQLGKLTLWNRPIRKEITLVSVSPPEPYYRFYPTLLVTGQPLNQTADSSGSCTWDLTASVVESIPNGYWIQWSELDYPFWIDGPHMRTVLPKGRTLVTEVSASPNNDLRSSSALKTIGLSCI